jgi:hypothetical protein
MSDICLDHHRENFFDQSPSKQCWISKAGYEQERSFEKLWERKKYFIVHLYSEHLKHEKSLIELALKCHIKSARKLKKVV